MIKQTCLLHLALAKHKKQQEYEYQKNIVKKNIDKEHGLGSWNQDANEFNNSCDNIQGHIKNGAKGNF